MGNYNASKKNKEVLSMSQELKDKEFDYKTLLSCHNFNKSADINRLESKEREKTIIISQCDGSDFRYEPYEKELKAFPFGAERVSVTLFPNGSTSFSYKNTNTFDGTDSKENAKSLYELLDKIQHPYYLEMFVDSIESFKDDLKHPLSSYISGSELDTLKNKMPMLEKQLQSKKEGAIKYIEEKYAYSEGTLNEEDDIDMVP